MNVVRSLAGALAAVVVLAFSGGCAPPRSSTQAATPENQVAELQVQDLMVGQGAEATPGAKVTVHYSGWLYDHAAPDHKGKPFDSSREGGQPFSFALGARQVIAGWDQGVAGMRVGGQRRLVIPSALAYGEQGAGGVIPPMATLVFDVELLDVQPAPAR
ncbi:MAG TPA: FKBP-type peptidyl-prolyl cis-trans isomerase [Steroidobacteraceae bacterium]|nr:FKBP-type peptidyl-prolyl cis-trans isomerase [Steroidobacteraceae bacterium]